MPVCPVCPVCPGGGVQAVQVFHGCHMFRHSDTTNTRSEKSPLFAFIVVRWYIIPLRLVKPSICPQIEPHEKNRKTMNEERKKNPARRRGKF